MVDYAGSLPTKLQRPPIASAPLWLKYCDAVSRVMEKRERQTPRP